MKLRRARLPRLALLVALVLTIAATLTACGSSGSTTIIQTTTVTGGSTTDSTSTESTTSTTTSTSTTDKTTADGPVHSYEQFQSPSKNIGCVMFNGGARCDAKSHQWKAGPAPADCPLDYGDGLEVGGNGGADFVCAGDTTLGAGPILGYGESSEVKGAKCLSAQDGITCTDSSGAGFFISIQKYEFIG